MPSNGSAWTLKLPPNCSFSEACTLLPTSYLAALRMQEIHTARGARKTFTKEDFFFLLKILRFLKTCNDKEKYCVNNAGVDMEKIRKVTRITSW